MAGVYAKKEGNERIKTVFFDLGNTIVDYHSGKLTDEEKNILGLWSMHCKLKKIGVKIKFEELINIFIDIEGAKKFINSFCEITAELIKNTF